MKKRSQTRPDFRANPYDGKINKGCELWLKSFYIRFVYWCCHKLPITVDVHFLCVVYIRNKCFFFTSFKIVTFSSYVFSFFHLCSTNKLIIPESICHSSFLLQAARIYKNLTDTRKKLKWLRSLGNQTVIIWSKGTLDRIKKIELKRPWLHNIITICAMIFFFVKSPGKFNCS